MPATKTLLQKLFTLFTGALLGYFWGWIWGWSLFDPNSDVWALLAGVGALVGLIAGVTPFVWRYRGVLASASIGLYLSWIVRTLLFGDKPGGWGILFLGLGAIAGLIIGVRLCSPADAKQKVITGLVVALYAGFFGGFLVDVVLLDLLLGVVKSHSILGNAPAVIGCGLLGGILAARWQVRKANS